MAALHSQAELSRSVLPTIAAAAQIGAAVLVFRPDDSIAHVNAGAAQLYPFCEFNARATDLRSWFFSTLNAGQITQKEALQDPTGWVGHIAIARRMNRRLEFVREYSNGTKVLCSHVNFDDAWSAQIRINITSSEIPSFSEGNESLPFYIQYHNIHKECLRLQAIQDRIGIGIAIVTQDCEILRSNQAFKDLVSRNDGFNYIDYNRFQASSPNDQEKLHRAIGPQWRELNSRRNVILPISRPLSQVPHMVSIRSAVEWEKGASMLVVSSSNIDVEEIIEVLHRDFNLTKRQAAIASSIGMGESAAYISEKMNISRDTVYVQIKRIFKRLCEGNIMINGQQSLVHLVSLIRSVSASYRKM